MGEINPDDTNLLRIGNSKTVMSQQRSMPMTQILNQSRENINVGELLRGAKEEKNVTEVIVSKTLAPSPSKRVMTTQMSAVENLDVNPVFTSKKRDLNALIDYYVKKPKRNDSQTSSKIKSNPYNDRAPEFEANTIEKQV